MARVDYDPKKAHEYYMKHRKLKGKSYSQKKFSNTQKEQFFYAKGQLKEQLEINNFNARERIKEAKQKQKEQITAQTKAKIDAIREKYKTMSRAQRTAMREQIGAAIDALREVARSQKAAVQEKASEDTKTAIANNKAEFDKALDAAYKKIGKSRKKR